MRAFITVALVVLAGEGVSRCACLMADRYPRELSQWADVLALVAIVGLLALGVVAIRAG